MTKKISFVVFLLFILLGGFVVYLARDPFSLSEEEVSKRLKSLAGQVAIITGSSGGVGSALAEQAAKYGLKLVLADIRPERSIDIAQKINRSGGEAIALEVDLSDPVQRKTLVERTIQKFGTIDLLFNNAGYSYVTITENLDLAKMANIFEVNFFAGVDLARLVIPAMKRQGGGYIVNVSSIVGHLPEVAGEDLNSMYVATKAALTSWSYKLHLEMKPFGIRVKVISPSGLLNSGFLKNTVGLVGGGAYKQSSLVFETPETVAKETFAALVNGSLVTLPGKARGIYRATTLQNENRLSVSQPFAN